MLVKKSLPSCCVCVVCWWCFLFYPSYLSLTDFSLLFLSLCLSKIRAKGVEHLVHYFRDTAWYSTTCLFYKTSSQPLLLCLHGLLFCTVRTAHLHYIPFILFSWSRLSSNLFLYFILFCQAHCVFHSLLSVWPTHIILWNLSLHLLLPELETWPVPDSLALSHCLYMGIM